MALGRELLRLTLGQEDMGTRSRSTLRCSSLAANITRTSQAKWLGVSPRCRGSWEGSRISGRVARRRAVAAPSGFRAAPGRPGPGARADAVPPAVLLVVRLQPRHGLAQFPLALARVARTAAGVVAARGVGNDESPEVLCCWARACSTSCLTTKASYSWTMCLRTCARECAHMCRHVFAQCFAEN